ncbi:conserved hypothetical protein [Paecilomyces variotii No. 5]|uniref:Alpha/Beta hydrolase protein n=1 Tax=Byssochlamys spectabilis (strain No. 5 / NBRC 109023) TaxID=1356009 RepID=V5FK48_BYSSN|nr:conserved hypothetical protein [Paecilomyces variotii No. 5]
MQSTHASEPPQVSRKAFPIAGIATTVFGLDELPSHISTIACLWLLHPRLSNQERMAGIAGTIITDWNQRLANGQSSSNQGLIAVSFDQRNHGTRLVEPLANEAWKQGNPRHAQDMFSIFQGTARDTSLLLDYLPSYVFPKSDRTITTNLVLGVSLGGHAAWSCILHEPRITSGVVIIGCPDYVNLMADRARLSKLPSWTGSDPQGSQFLGSEHFPHSLLDTVRNYDLASLLLNHMRSDAKDKPLHDDPIPEPCEEEKTVLRPLLTSSLAGKRILNLSGGADKLVPYKRGEAILTWLKKTVGPGGWFTDGGVHFEDIIVETAGHEVTPGMVQEASRFVAETLSTNGRVSKTGFVRESKI